MCQLARVTIVSKRTVTASSKSERSAEHCCATASKKKHERIRELGGTPIDHRNEDFVERVGELCPGGVDATFDGIGAANLRRSVKALKRGGVAVGFGLTGALEDGLGGVLSWVSTLARLKLTPNGKRTSIYLIGVGRAASWRKCRDDWQEHLQMAERGALKPVIGDVLALDRVREAHELIDAGKVVGKIVLTP